METKVPTMPNTLTNKTAFVAGPSRGIGKAIAIALAIGVLASGTVFAQGLEYVKSHYTKYEHRVPMRDGKRLFTAVYVPKEESQRYPILLYRTPYSVRPYGADQSKSDLGPSPLFGKQGYIFFSFP